MEPSISNISETNNMLTFTLKGVNVSIANGLRRVPPVQRRMLHSMMAFPRSSRHYHVV